ncbi:MAG: hypothetical protein M3R24_09990 [Chloroflexota bacterium]|nr:hypothetical protein [Chloroflexota bacterium]
MSQDEVRHLVGSVKAIPLVAVRSFAEDHYANGVEELIEHNGGVSRRREVPVVEAAIFVVGSSHKAV